MTPKSIWRHWPRGWSPSLEAAKQQAEINVKRREAADEIYLRQRCRERRAQVYYDKRQRSGKFVRVGEQGVIPIMSFRLSYLKWERDRRFISMNLRRMI